jgi:type I restriction enzyme S subunit
MSSDELRGIVPKGWLKKELGEVCLKVLKIDPLDLGREVFKYVDIGSIDSATKNVASPQILSVKEAPGRARQLIQEGDTVFSTVRPYMKNIAYINEALDGEIASTGFCVIRADSDFVSKGFIKFFSSSDSLLEQILPLQRGVSYPAVRDNDIFSASVLVPPFMEQQRIVEILEEQLSRLDAALASVYAVRVKATRLRRSLLKAAFTGTLTGHDATIGVPKGWNITKLGNCVEFSPKIPKEALEESVAVSFVPMTKVMEVTGQVELDETISANEGKRRNLTYFEDGDVIFAKITPCMENGKVARPVGLVNGAAFGSTEFHVLRPSNGIIGEYLRLLLVHDDFRRDAERAMTGAVGQRRVPRKYLELYELALPPIKEQIEIVAILDEQLSRLDATLEVVNEIERKSSAFRRSILHAAFTGELTKEWREGANV